MVQSFIQATGDRVIDRWSRPQALPGGTLTIGYTIFTTGEDVRAAKDDPKVTSKVGWLPPPTVSEMAYFTLAMVRPNTPTGDRYPAGQGRGWGADEGGHRRSWWCANN
jgi:hypothetical protein